MTDQTTTIKKAKPTADQIFWEKRKSHLAYAACAKLTPADLHKPGALDLLMDYPDAMSQEVKDVINMLEEAYCPTCNRPI